MKKYQLSQFEKVMAHPLFKFLFLILISSISHDVRSQHAVARYTLTVDVSQLSKQINTVYLIYKDNGKNFQDSSMVINNIALFRGSLTEPVRAIVRFSLSSGKLDVDGKKPIKGFPEMPKNQFYFFLDSGNVNMNVREPLITSEISGSKAQQESILFDKLTAPLNRKKDSLYVKFIEFDSLKNQNGINSVEAGLIEIDTKMKQLYKDHVLNNPSSQLSVYLFTRYASSRSKFKDIEPLLEKLPVAFRESYSVRSAVETVKVKEQTTIGSIPSDFILPDTSGVNITLSSFRGKFVLVDFWASWCGPCRSENPNLVKVYNELKGKNFTILSIALEKSKADRQKWMTAIHKDKLKWMNVSDLMYYDSPVAKQFGITAIPFNLLIDPNGKIIAKNLRGDDLVKRIGDLMFNNK